MPAWVLGIASRAWTGSMPSRRRRNPPPGGPAVEHGVLADRERQLAAQLLEWTWRSPCASTGLRRRRSQAPFGQANEHQCRGDRGGSDPVERRQASRHRPASRRTRKSPAGLGAQGRRSAAARTDSINQQALADDLAAEREDQQRRPVVRDDSFAKAERSGRSIAAPESAGEEQQRQRLEPRRAR